MYYVHVHGMIIIDKLFMFVLITCYALCHHRNNTIKCTCIIIYHVLLFLVVSKEKERWHCWRRRDWLSSITGNGRRWLHVFLIVRCEYWFHDSYCCTVCSSIVVNWMSTCVWTETVCLETFNSMKESCNRNNKQLISLWISFYPAVRVVYWACVTETLEET